MGWIGGWKFCSFVDFYFLKNCGRIHKISSIFSGVMTKNNFKWYNTYFEIVLYLTWNMTTTREKNCFLLSVKSISINFPITQTGLNISKKRLDFGFTTFQFLYFIKPQKNVLKVSTWRKNFIFSHFKNLNSQFIWVARVVEVGQVRELFGQIYAYCFGCPSHWSTKYFSFCI